MLAGTLEIQLMCDLARLNRDMGQARQVVGDAMGDISRVVDVAKKALVAFAGVASIKAFAGMVQGSIDAAGGMHDLSIQTGASVASLMAFKSVASTSETTIDGVTGAMGKMAKGMSGAGEDSAGVGQAIKALGIDFNKLKAMTPDQQMLAVATAMDKFRDGTGKAAVAMTLYGKEGAKMLPFMKDLAAESESVGAKLTEQQVQAKAAQAAMADDFGDNLTKIKKASDAWKKDLSMGMLPALYEASDAFLAVTTGAGGLKDGISKLSKDGSVTDWSRMAINGLTYVFDAAEGVKRVFTSIGNIIGASMAVLATNLGAMIEAGKKLIHGDISGAIGEVNSAVGQSKQIFSDLGTTLDQTWGEQTFGQKLRDRMEEVRRVGVEARKTKENLDFDSTADTASAAARKKEAEAYATLIAAIRAKTDENKLELAAGESVTESQKLQIKMDQELASGKLKLSDAHKAAADSALIELGVTEQAIKLQNSQRDVTKYIAASTAAREEQVAALDLEYRMYGKTADARAMEMVALDAEKWKKGALTDAENNHRPITAQIINQLNAERDARILVGQATLGQTKALQYAAQLQEENKRFGLEYIADDKARAAATLALDAKVWQERIALAGEGTEAQKLLQDQYTIWYANQALKPQLDAQKKMADSIESTMHDTFVSIVNGAKNMTDRIRDTLRNGLAEYLYQLFAKKWVLDVSTSISTGGVSGAATTAAGVGTGLTGLAQGASNLYGMISGGMTLAGGLGTGFMGSIAGGLTGAGVGSGLTSSLGMSIGNGILDVVGPGISSALAGGMGAIAAALPWVGGAIAVASLWNSAFGHGATETTGQGMTGWLNGTGAGGQTYQKQHQDGGWFSSDRDWTTSQDFSGQTTSQLSQAFLAIRASAQQAAQALGVSSASIDQFATTFNIQLSGDAAAQQKQIEDFFAGISDQMAHLALPNLDAFSKSGETASATLQRLAGDFKATDTMAQLLGKSAVDVFGSVGIESTKARERLIDLAGGADILSQQAASYAQNFLTDAQRLEPVQKALDAAMSSLGLSSVTTREQFKSCVDSLDLTTEAGAQQFSSMMKLADAFAQVHPAIEAIVTASRSAADVLSERNGLLDQLAQLTMSKEDYDKSKLDPSNFDVYGQVQAAQAAKDAIDKAKASADALVQVNKSFQDQIDTILKGRMSEAQVRALETAGMDASTRALYDRLAGLKAEDAATAAAAQAQQDAAAAWQQRLTDIQAANQKAEADRVAAAQAASQALQAIANQRASMELELYNLTNSAADQLAHKRELELAALAPTLIALQKQIYAMQDQAAAADAAAQQLQAAAAAAAAVASQRAGLERELYQAQGDTAKLRELELAALDPANRALKQQIFDLQDKTVADQAAAAAAKAFGDAQVQAVLNSQKAAADLKSAWQGITDSIFDEVARIRGLSSDGGALSLSDAQTKFAIATAQARAGDQDAAKLLPTLSKTLLDLAAQNAVSMVELRRIQSFTAVSLQQTGAGLGASLGLNVPIQPVNNSALMARLASPADNNGELVAEVRALRAEVVALREANSNENFHIAKYGQEAAGHLDDALNGEKPITTKALA
jgi:hypothetical protein